MAYEGRGMYLIVIKDKYKHFGSRLMGILGEAEAIFGDCYTAELGGRPGDIRIKTRDPLLASCFLDIANRLEGVVALCDIPLEQEKPIERPARMALLY